MLYRLLIIAFFTTMATFAQMPAIEPGVSHELAVWRSSHYSDVRYKLNLKLEKMSPVLKGTIEIRLRVSEQPALASGQNVSADPTPIILDWRRIRGSEQLSRISNVSLNGKLLSVSSNWPPAIAGGSDFNEHLIFRDGVALGENVIKLDFTSPILTSGSAITRYVDREDGAEYIYTLFVPSDASTAFPVFDQPDLKARFSLDIFTPNTWKVVTNSALDFESFHPEFADDPREIEARGSHSQVIYAPVGMRVRRYFETKPISTYVFAFATGPFEAFDDKGGNPSGSEGAPQSQSQTGTLPTGRVSASTADLAPHVYVRKSQAAKFKPHAAEVFRLTREGVKFLENYFDYKFPFPKYDIVLIPEFPFGGMEHAGATFLREASVIFPQEPTKNDYISRANLIFHETAHQWFGDTVTMKWFDDLWLKEGFAEFMAYKTLESVMPEYNAWKVFYERNKQAAYLTDSTRGTTPIYQPIANLSAAKSAYGNIVYRKAPSFLRQAEFYLGPDKFQTAVRAFLKKHEFANAGWEDLVKEFETASGQNLNVFASNWVKRRGLPVIRTNLAILEGSKIESRHLLQENRFDDGAFLTQAVNILTIGASGERRIRTIRFERANPVTGQLPISISDLPALDAPTEPPPRAAIPNYQDYGYGIFLLDDKSRDYVLKNIQNEKDDFLRTMMWGSLWDSVREGELDPKNYVELVVKILSSGVRSSDFSRPTAAKRPAKAGTQIVGETDEGTIQTLLGRVSTAMRYYLSSRDTLTGGTSMQKPARKQGLNTQRPSKALPNGQASASDLQTRVENLLIDRMQNASTQGQRITFYRSFLNIASTENARRILKVVLKGGNPTGSEGAPHAAPKQQSQGTLPNGRVSASNAPPTLRTKDRFDIVAKLITLGDPEAPKLLADLEKTETSDEARRYAYAAKAGFATAENKAKYWADYTANKDIAESWIESSLGAFNSVRQSDLSLPYLQQALAELPKLKRNRKIFFVNGWLGAFIGGQKSAEALEIVNKFLADNPDLDKDLRLKILENVDLIERAVRIRDKFGKSKEL